MRRVAAEALRGDLQDRPGTALAGIAAGRAALIQIDIDPGVSPLI